MSRQPKKSPPARMRTYRIEAEHRETPDLQKLAQLFIGVAFARVDAERHARQEPPRSPRQGEGGEVES